MKIVLIDDIPNFVVDFAKKKVAGHELFGIFVSYNFTKVFDHAGPREDLSIDDAVSGAGIIFLDHNMPVKGDVLLKSFQDKGLITDKTRVIGTSSDFQQYLKERVTAGEASDPICIAEIASQTF
jgi:hypothetical protein